jgi:hypothetical protein
MTYTVSCVVLTISLTMACCVFVGESRSLYRPDSRNGTISWRAESLSMLDDLEELAKHAHEWETSGGTLTDAHGRIWQIPKNVEGYFSNSSKGDELLWKLWLLTGASPQVEDKGEAIGSHLKKNVEAYRKYIDENRDVSEEQLARKGLDNAVKAISSPLWYSTTKYLREKTGCRANFGFMIDVFPPRHIMTTPLEKDSYRRLVLCQ